MEEKQDAKYIKQNGERVLMIPFFVHEEYIYESRREKKKIRTWFVCSIVLLVLTNVFWLLRG